MSPPLAGLIGAGAVVVAIAQALAQSGSVSISADEITRAFVGKVCTTKAGAKFTFSRDGHYAYSGLWQNGGHYRVHDHAVIVLLDSGLEREFAVSRNGNIYYLEETAVSCRDVTLADMPER
jgi:hypothetical protein